MPVQSNLKYVVIHGLNDSLQLRFRYVLVGQFGSLCHISCSSKQIFGSVVNPICVFITEDQRQTKDANGTTVSHS